ncbi:MAG TPA: hypothetical protein VGJ15_07070, partial [Pirellulales bacterium]
MNWLANKKLTRIAIAIVTATTLVTFYSTKTTRAANGTWNQFTPGNYSWDTPGNWLGGTFADGPGSTALFNTADPTGINVNLDGQPRSVGTLILSSRNNGNGWVINGPQTLTLDNGASSPVILTSQALPYYVTTINAPINSSNGFSLNGVGTVSLGAALPNTFAGPIILANNNNALNNTAVLQFSVDNPNVKSIQFGTVTAGSSNIATATTGS